MPIIKLVFADDIRRFALENEATSLETIERLVGSTFNLSPNEFNLNYVDTDNDKVSISTDEELEEALQQAQGLPLKINVQKLPGKVQDGAAKDFLRSSKSFTNEVNKPFQISPPNTPKPKVPVMEVPLQPEPIKPAVTKPVSPLVSMLSNRKTQDELTSLVFKTLQSPHFMDWVMNNDLLPGFFSVMAEVAKEGTPVENVVEKEIEKPLEKPQKAASEPILEPVKPLFNANNSVSIPEDKQTNPIKAEEKHVNEVENQPAEEQEQDGFVVVKKEPVIPGEEPEPEVEQKEPGLVQSLLSIFKKKEEDEIPNQEEHLKKLADMGFTDKESNLKALRFHKKYNEGLDEVVEDLLLQRTTKAAEKDALQLSPIPLLPEINSKS